MITEVLLFARPERIRILNKDVRVPNFKFNYIAKLSWSPFSLIVRVVNSVHKDIIVLHSLIEYSKDEVAIQPLGSSEFTGQHTVWLKSSMIMSPGIDKLNLGPTLFTQRNHESPWDSFH